MVGGHTVVESDQSSVAILGGSWHSLAVHAGVLDDDLVLITLDSSDPFVHRIIRKLDALHLVQLGPHLWVVIAVVRVEDGEIDRGLVIVKLHLSPDLSSIEFCCESRSEAKGGFGVAAIDFGEVVGFLYLRDEIALTDLVVWKSVEFGDQDELSVLPEVVLDPIVGFFSSHNVVFVVPGEYVINHVENLEVGIVSDNRGVRGSLDRVRVFVAVAFVGDQQITDLVLLGVLDPDSDEVHLVEDSEVRVGSEFL